MEVLKEIIRGARHAGSCSSTRPDLVLAPLPAPEESGDEEGAAEVEFEERAEVEATEVEKVEESRELEEKGTEVEEGSDQEVAKTTELQAENGFEVEESLEVEKTTELKDEFEGSSDVESPDSSEVESCEGLDPKRTVHDCLAEARALLNNLKHCRPAQEGKEDDVVTQPPKNPKQRTAVRTALCDPGSLQDQIEKLLEGCKKVDEEDEEDISARQRHVKRSLKMQARAKATTRAANGEEAKRRKAAAQEKKVSAAKKNPADEKKPAAPAANKGSDEKKPAAKKGSSAEEKPAAKSGSDEKKSAAKEEEACSKGP